ncbi:MAG: 4Fe-4S dicluster domain-containing protein [Actinobacteria bacterium]|nr:4Fe-4S dicluster domain-containing protein [Actinomycetota bacterium]
MIISVASGKGGTGKTTIAVNLALSLSNVQLLDCDVEEPNCHIFIKPVFENKNIVFIPIPQVDSKKCDGCGRCQEFCAYNAIAVVNKEVLIFSELCHGCGSCTYFCPNDAIEEENKKIGIIEIGKKNGIQFVHGKLDVGMMMSPPVIRAVKKHVNKKKTVIIDAPPGTSCPVITAIKDTDFVILVTEPTPFGLNELSLAVEVVRKLKIPFGVIINRSDLGNKKTDEYCVRENIPILMRIPFSKKIAEIYSRGDSIIETLPEYRENFQRLFENIKQGKNWLRIK